MEITLPSHGVENIPSPGMTRIEMVTSDTKKARVASHTREVNSRVHRKLDLARAFEETEEKRLFCSRNESIDTLMLRRLSLCWGGGAA